jgi:hypothetical protein
MDLASEAWDVARGVLTLRASANGPPARTGELVVAVPNGPLRRVSFATSAPDAMELHVI